MNYEPHVKMLGAFLAFPEVVDTLIEKAKQTPYYDILNKDNSLYMGRYWLRPYGEDNGLAARLHHIARPDLDRHLHDHPWDFTSVVLRGGYVEARPAHEWAPKWKRNAADMSSSEDFITTRRGPGDIAYRLARNRHRILSVEPDTWTLFITGPKVQDWGFYTPEGKVPWRKYLGLPEGTKE